MPREYLEQRAITFDRLTATQSSLTRAAGCDCELSHSADCGGKRSLGRGQASQHSTRSATGAPGDLRRMPGRSAAAPSLRRVAVKLNGCATDGSSLLSTPKAFNSKAQGREAHPGLRYQAGIYPEGVEQDSRSIDFRNKGRRSLVENTMWS